MHRSALLWVVLLAAPSAAVGQGGSAAPPSDQVYEGWRQYSVHCARCHGQDVLGNPVAANLLVSVAPGGPAAGKDVFLEVVAKGRPDKGMPGFAEQMSAAQMEAVYSYVKGRAAKSVPPGRPKKPTGS